MTLLQFDSARGEKRRRNGIDSALLGLRRTSVRDLTRDDLIVPASFEWRLGVAEGLGAVRP